MADGFLRKTTLELKKRVHMTVRPALILQTAAWIFAVFLLAMAWGCAPKPVHVPVEEPPVTETEKIPLQDPAEQTAARIEILETEAEKFIDLGELKQALYIYNQAMAEGPETFQKKRITAGIEKVLARAEPALIQDVLETPDLAAVPEPLLRYWLGVNLAQNEAYPEALSSLNRFVDTWPDHPRAPEAIELITLIQETVFKKDTIGCLLPLSGKYAVYGKKALNGIQLALQDLAQTHGRRFNIIVKDTRGDPETAAACVDELDQANVAGIIGPLLAVDTAGDRAQELKIPLIALTQKAEFPLSGDYLFSNFITPQMQVSTLAAYVFKTLGLEKVAILYPDEPYGRRYMQLFLDAVDEYNGQVMRVEAYDGSATDFTTPIRKLTVESDPNPDFIPPGTSDDLDFHELDIAALDDNIQQDPEGEPGAEENRPETDSTDKIIIDFQALFIPDSASRINMILPQLAFNDVKDIVLLGTNLWHHESLPRLTKGYNRRTVITDGYFGSSKKPGTARFENAFTALYGDSPGFLEAICYDTARILLSTAMDPSVSTREQLKDALLAGILFEGATGNTLLDSTGAARKELFLITIKNNRFVEIER
jgi:branched-chain amino acid transport system substrate-binding protein